MALSFFYVSRLRLMVIIFKIKLFILRIQLAVIHTADFGDLSIFVRVCTERNLIMRSMHWEDSKKCSKINLLKI